MTTEHMLGETILSTSTPVTASNPELSTAPVLSAESKARIVATLEQRHSPRLPATTSRTGRSSRLVQRPRSHPNTGPPRRRRRLPHGMRDLRTETGEHAYLMNNTLTR